MKGVITAAGLGTRSGLNGKLRKEMLPMYEFLDGEIVLRPMLDIIYRRMKNFGIDDIIIVLNPEDSATRDYLKRNMEDTTVVFQEEPLGYGNAVLQAKEAVAGDSVFLNAGDAILLDENLASLPITENSGDSIDLFMFRVKDPTRYGVATVSESGMGSKLSGSIGSRLTVTGVEEKPAHPSSDLAICATYFLPNTIFETLAEPGTGGELTPAIDRLIKNGTRAHGIEVPAYQWISVGRAEEYVEVLSRSLEWARRSRQS